ncbi:MAG: hypothetical protein GY936_18225 [Ignavibacteriae bacterium]|nr:hypothetical protein [Ignavibacteriota bacterium]
MKTIYISIFLLIYSISIAQSKFELNGYLQNMQTVWAPNQVGSWFFQNSMSNRFNFTYYPSDNITVNASLRNIFDYGQFVSLIPNYNETATLDAGYFNFTKKITSNNSVILYSNIDRLNLLFSKENYEIQIGRQRVNLGMSMVWTPNDIFNSSSFLNFDYVEKSGSDAIRVQYYTGVASSVQLVTKLNHKEEISAAAIIKLNEWNYDFQFLTGIMEDDYVIGGGWAGQIKDIGFTGEFTYFRDKNNFQDTTGIVISTVGANYTFSNSLSLQAEFLYNSNGRTDKVVNTNNLFSLEYSAKNLSPAKYSLFGQIAYPITPLISGSLSSIFNPSDNSFFLNPSVEISLNEDVYLLTSGQFFFGDEFTEWGDYGQFYYLRLKWNF